MKKVTEPEKTALERILATLDAAEKNNIPREAAIVTALSVEIQSMENRIDELEGKLEDAEARIKDLEELPATEFPRGQNI